MTIKMEKEDRFQIVLWIGLTGLTDKLGLDGRRKWEIKDVAEMGQTDFSNHEQTFVLAVMLPQHIMEMKWGHVWKQMIQVWPTVETYKVFVFTLTLDVFIRSL